MLLQNQTFVETYGSDAHTKNGAINGTTGARSAYKTWDVENTTDSAVTVNGFWLDLGGNTLTIKSHRSAFVVSDSVPLNIKNGTIVFGLDRNAMVSGKGIIQMGYWDDAVGSTTNGYNYNPTITLKDVNFYRSVLETGSPKLYAGPVIAGIFLGSTINVYDSTIISSGSNAIRYRKSASTSGVRWITVTPAILSPFRTAHCTGAAPR